MLDSGWNVRSLRSAATRAKVEFENTNGVGPSKQYARVKVPEKPVIFPAYELNRAYVDTDLFMSMAKLKNHATCGVTLSMKNCFGNTPASIYGDDAGADEPNESPDARARERLPLREAAAASSGAARVGSEVSREIRVTACLESRPSLLPRGRSTLPSSTVWRRCGRRRSLVRGLRFIRPGVLLLGTNGVTTDAVATAVMGYDPQAAEGQGSIQRLRQHVETGGSFGGGYGGSKED